MSQQTTGLWDRRPHLLSQTDKLFLLIFWQFLCISTTVVLRHTPKFKARFFWCTEYIKISYLLMTEPWGLSGLRVSAVTWLGWGISQADGALRAVCFAGSAGSLNSLPIGHSHGGFADLLSQPRGSTQSVYSALAVSHGGGSPHDGKPAQEKGRTGRWCRGQRGH